MTIDRNGLNRVREEMLRLEERFQDVEDEWNKHPLIAEKGTPWGFPRETGAVRRASMDLTRALADLRNWRK